MANQNTLTASLAVWEAQPARPAQHAGGWIYGPVLPTALISMLLLSLLSGALIYLARLSASMLHAYVTKLLGAVTGWPLNMRFWLLLD